MWQRCNSQRGLGEDKIFGWLLELTQKHLSGPLLSFESFPASYQESINAFILFACISEINQRHKYVPPLPYTAPVRVQIIARGSKYHSMPAFPTFHLLQARSLELLPSLVHSAAMEFLWHCPLWVVPYLTGFQHVSGLTGFQHVCLHYAPLSCLILSPALWSEVT